MTHPIATPPPVAPDTILDYASPGLKKKLRLPSRSILTFHIHDQDLTVVESVQAKASAIAALVFAGFILLWLASLMLTVPRVTGVFGFFWIIEFSLLLLVIHDTWRTTTLTVRVTGIDLCFSSPFRRRQYHWPAADFRHAAVYATDLTKHPALGVLVLTTIPTTLRLFDGHDHDQLASLAGTIDQTFIPGSAIPPAAIPVARTAQNP